MKICFFLQENMMFPGATRSAIDLIAELKRRSIDVIVILPHKGDIEPELQKLQVKWHYCWTSAQTYEVNNKVRFWRLCYLRRKVRNYVSIKKLSKRLKDEQIDLLHINKITASAGMLLAKRLRVPCVWHIREFLLEDYGRKFFYEKEHYAMMRQADCIVAISNEIKTYFTPVIKSEIKVVYNGINPSKIQRNTEALQKENKVGLIMAATIIEGKNQLEALQALNILRKKLPDISLKLYIIGKVQSEEYMKKLKVYVEENHLEQDVCFLDYVADINALRASCDIGLCCSLNEAFGRINVENMLSGLLAVGSDAGGTKEIIEDGKTGVLYHLGNPENLADKLYEAIVDREKAKKIIKNGTAAAEENFTIQATANNMIQIYQQVIS